MKRLVCFVLAIALVFSNVNVSYANDYTLVEDTVVKEKRTFNWNDFSTSYYYVRLSEKYRDLYDVMYEILEDYFNGDIGTVSTKAKKLGTQKVLEECVEKDNTTYKDSDYLNIFYLVCYENPKFFFVQPLIYTNSENQVCFGVNKQFSTKKKMSAEKEKVKKRLEDYIKDINKNVKLKTVNDLSYYIARKIYRNIPYDWSVVAFWKDDDKPMSQTIYSALINKTTVCAGYSKLFAALMNYYGMDTICVLGKEHAWNMTNIDGEWYVTDLTQSTYYGDFYLFANQKQLKKYDGDLLDDKKLHNPKAFYVKKIPNISTKNYKNTYQFVEEKPEILYSTTEDGKYVNIQISTKSDATIYYSLDGDKIKEYTGMMTVKSNKDHKIYAYAKGKNTMQSAESVKIIRK